MSAAKTPVVWDETAKKHRPLGTGEKVGGLVGDSLLSSDSGNLVQTGSDGLIYATGSGMSDPRPDNFLEASGSGRLQVTPERLTEWFDSHPSAAADFAAALRVVSGDSGNVIVPGSDSGAFLDSSALADALSGMSAANLQKLAAALADGRTITASGGRLTVDPTSATAAQLSKISAAIRKSAGGLAVGSDGKLYVDFEQMDPDIMRQVVLSMVASGGGLAVYGSGSQKGKLYVDFASMDPAIMQSVVQSMVQDGSGLGVDSNGQLYVDFSLMPTDKFESLLSSLRMLIPLERGKTVYVNPGSENSADAGISVSGWGESYTKNPFTTVQGAVNYVTGKYSLGKYNISIKIAPGVYNESVTLPEYSSGSGSISLRPYSGERDVEIASASISSSGRRGPAIAASGSGSWSLFYLILSRLENPITVSGQTTSLLSASSGARLYLYGCEYRQSFPADPSPLGGLPYGIRLFNADGDGVINIQHGTYPHVLSAAIEDGVTSSILFAARGGRIVLSLSSSDSVSHEFVCSGSCSVFANAWQSGSISTAGNGSRLSFTGTMSGRRYHATAGSSIFTGTGSSVYFPGSDDESGDGYVEESTYCWYA